MRGEAIVEEFAPYPFGLDENYLIRPAAAPAQMVRSATGHSLQERPSGKSSYVRCDAESGPSSASQRNDAKCHVWTAPRWQGFSSRLQLGRCSHVFGLLGRFS